MHAKNRDFLDQDLVAGSPAAGGDSLFNESRDAAAGANIGQLIEQRHERTSRMANAAQEIQQLRSRQTELEREKTSLETLTSKQDEYEQGKREIMLKLEKGIVLLKKQSEETVQAAELLSLVRTRYQDALKDLREVRENDWKAGDFEHEVTRAMALVEKAQAVHIKGVAKVNACTWLKSSGESKFQRETTTALAPPASPGFAYWLRAGIAFSLPLVLVIAACFVVWLYLNGVF